MSSTSARNRLGLDGQAYIAAHGFQCALADDVVLVFDSSLAPAPSARHRLLRRFRSERHPFRAVHHGDDVDIVVATGPGAPIAGVTVELLAAFGVKRVVSVGLAAGTADTRLGAVFTVAEAADLHGHLPCPGAEPAPRTGPLHDALTAASDGVANAHTTLWPFAVDAAALVGSSTTRPTVVEMEARALFATGDRLGVEIETVVAISDRYDSNGDWTLGDPIETDAALRRAFDIAATSLRSTSPVHRSGTSVDRSAR